MSEEIKESLLSLYEINYQTKEQVLEINHIQ